VREKNMTDHHLQADDANNLLRASLASLSLPGSLDALQNPKSVPTSLAARAGDVRSAGG
jgi:hypothetical protein